jgi:hypothetical protein
MPERSSVDCRSRPDYIGELSSQQPSSSCSRYYVSVAGLIPRLPALSLCRTTQGRVPDNLIKLWMGRSQNLMDLCAAQLRLDVAYRREWCESAGFGFELGELGYKLNHYG